MMIGHPLHPQHLGDWIAEAAGSVDGHLVENTVVGQRDRCPLRRRGERIGLLPVLLQRERPVRHHLHGCLADLAGEELLREVLGTTSRSSSSPGQISEAAVQVMSRCRRTGRRRFRALAGCGAGTDPVDRLPRFRRGPVYASRRFRDPVAEVLRVESIRIIIGDDQLERVSGLLVAVDPEVEFGT